MSVAAANKLTIALVAGEQSGDILGAGLMQALQQHPTRFTFSGIGGPRMQALGLQSLAPMEALSVMGLVEPLKHLFVRYTNHIAVAAKLRQRKNSVSLTQIGYALP